eukprot:scaffold8260_cov109-Isochrysis_galbana.AAC.2
MRARWQRRTRGRLGCYTQTHTHPSPRTRAGGWLSNGLPRRQPTRPPLRANRRAHQGAGRRGQDGISRAGDRDRRADGRGGKAQARQRGGGARATTGGGGARATMRGWALVVEGCVCGGDDPPNAKGVERYRRRRAR